jgi:hypothetical protein
MQVQADLLKRGRWALLQLVQIHQPREWEVSLADREQLLAARIAWQ